jgi:hypothetical protein
VFGPGGRLTPVLAGGSTTGVQQSNLAKLCAPPAKRGFGKAWAGIFIFYIVLCILTAGVALIGLPLFILVVIGMGVAEAKHAKWNTDEWPTLHAAWQRKWVCLRCHRQYEPQNLSGNVAADVPPAVPQLVGSAAQSGKDVLPAAAGTKKKLPKAFTGCLMVGGVVFLLLVIVGAIVGPPDKSRTSPQPTTPPSSESSWSWFSKITEANYEKLSTGMSLAQVTAILGKPTDEVTSTSSSPGVDLGQGNYVPSMTATVHTWHSGSSTIVIEFMNDQLVSKTKAGF